MTNWEIYEDAIKKSKEKAHCIIYKLRTGELECKPKHRGCTRKEILNNFDWLFADYDEKEIKIGVNLYDLTGCDMPISTWLKEEYKNRCSDCPNLTKSGKKWMCESVFKPCKSIYPCPASVRGMSWFVEKIHENELKLVERGYSEKKAKEIAEECKKIISLL